MANQLVDKSFLRQAIDFPKIVDTRLAAIHSANDAKELLDMGAAMQAYFESIKAGIEICRPVSYGVLKIKAKLGELLPRGKVGAGRGNKNPAPDTGFFASHTLSAYRKLADNAARLPEYYEQTPDDVPTQTDFIRWCGCDNVLATKFTGAIEWYTPAAYVESARQVMGDIDLDPASTKYAQTVVKAGRFHTATDDGLAHEWSGRVWLNPPFKPPLINQFVDKLCKSAEDRDIDQAVLLTNNNTDSGWWHQAAEMAAAVCFTRGRISFYNRAGEWSAPTNGQTFFYFGKRAAKFHDVFGEHGLIY